MHSYERGSMLEKGVKDVRDTELHPPLSGPLKSSNSRVCEGLLSRDDMERRRMEAAEDLLHGLPHSHVVAKFGVSRTTASRWHRALTANGLESLRKVKAPGRPSRLTPEQKAQIAAMFGQGAVALGVADNRWTAARLARVIEDRFSVRYSLDHVGRLLAKLEPTRNLSTSDTVM
jgi:transposase